MMQLLIPLGLLGLVGILVLILIYIIKPNYQTHHISTTFVWKLSLKYKRRRLPTSRVRNIILFICQALILASIALILAQPAIVYEKDTGENDVIAIIDSSASMYAGKNGDTRFQRAVSGIEELSGSTLRSGGYMSVIIADAKPYFLARRVSERESSTLIDQIDELARDENACSYGVSDIDAAMVLTEEVLAENPSAKIYLYTDKTYTYDPATVTVVPVGEKGEWNAGVLSVSYELVDGYYSVTAEVACYGSSESIEVGLEVLGADAEDAATGGRRIPPITKVIDCDDSSVKRVIFCAGGGLDTPDVFYCDIEDNQFSRFQTLHISITEQDDFMRDNDYYVYGGLKETVRIVYASADPNPFFSSALDSLKKRFADRWAFDVREIQKGQEAPTEGYDLYIYEHKGCMPRVLPMDGAVILADPQDGLPLASGLSVRTVKQFNSNTLVPCTSSVSHPVTEHIIPGNIQFNQYWVYDFNESYEALLSVGADPLLLVQNHEDVKVAVLPFSVHYSNIVLQPEWFILLYNLFEYFLPSTVVGSEFEVGEAITVNGRGPSVSYSDFEDPIEEFPATLQFSLPGTYTLRQKLYFENKDDVYTNIFVRINRAESNIWTQEDILEEPYKEDVTTNAYDDLLVYFAAALVALLFLEWFLHSREVR